MRLQILSLALLVPTFGTAEEGCSLRVVAEGVKNAKGRVGFMLFDSAEGWPKDFEQAYQRGGLSAVEGDIEWEFQQLPAGSYGVIVVHDENENRKLDRSPIGNPVEGWGMSNNPKPKLRAPKFSTAAFDLQCGEQIAIRLRY